jgi:hypothetical protein
MARTYLNSQGPQGFGKFSSSSSDKAYLRIESKISKQLFVHTPHHSKKHIPNKLALRIKSSKMPTSLPPKRPRRDSDADERPAKLQRCTSLPRMVYLIFRSDLGSCTDPLFSATSLAQDRPSRCVSLPRMDHLFSQLDLNTVLTFCFQHRNGPALKAAES